MNGGENARPPNKNGNENSFLPRERVALDKQIIASHTRVINKTQGRFISVIIHFHSHNIHIIVYITNIHSIDLY